MKRNYPTLLLFLIFCLVLYPTVIQAQKQITVDPTLQFQTIHGFGASDAWNTDFVGRHWSATVRDDIAKKLFSQQFNANGTPEGIGLSRWRFNIGGGSTEQGSASNIDMEERRVECFLNEDGSYNWEKQKGQQWFLQKAKDHGVEHLVAFVNSPPRFYTKNGRTNSDNPDRNGPTNLKTDHYDEFAGFLVTVLQHFHNKGLAFSQISPVNEPQYEWRDGQEGCPWTNQEIKTLAVALNDSIVSRGLDTRMLLAEAASYDYIHKVSGSADKSDQIWKFFNASRPEYLGGLSQMLPGIAAHSYWTDDSDARIREARENILRESKEQGGIELYQSEYNLLSTHLNNKNDNTLFLAKMIYADLAIANMSIWDYWTAMERERWSQLNRFYLVRLRPSGGDYGSLTGGGTVVYDKNLWALGNYSMFIRPGYKRISATGAEDLSGLMGSAYLAPDSSRIVMVYVNWATTADTITHDFRNLPEGYRVRDIKPYITNSSNNLAPKAAITDSTSYELAPRSITTLLVNLEKISNAVSETRLHTTLLYPNPSTGKVFFNSDELRNTAYRLTDLSGRTVMSGVLGDTPEHDIDLSATNRGTYILQAGKNVWKLVKD